MTCKISEHVTTEPECSAESAYTWQWPWGNTGEVCHQHAPLVRQLAQRLGYEALPLHPVAAVSAAAAATGNPDELARAERAELALVEARAQLASAEEGAASLRRQIGQLQSDLNDARKRIAELEAQTEP